MQRDHRAAARLGLVLVMVGAVGAVGWLGGGRNAPAGKGAAPILVVPAARASASPAPLLAGAGSQPDEPRRSAAIAHVRQAYPLLRDPALVCAQGRCALTGLILPPTDQAYLDQRQEMLLGGLKAVLAIHGYRTSAPVQLDEVDSNKFLLSVAVE